MRASYLVRHHSRALNVALQSVPAAQLDGWAAHLAGMLAVGGRLLVAGNGGSAAQAQHLTAELVGRFGRERAPLSALALHAETSSLTAIANDYGYEEVFARQVIAHGRPGDVLLLMSASGASINLVRAAIAAHQQGLRVWGLTGPVPNLLAEHCDEVVAVASTSAATTQECHLALLHLLCELIDETLPGPDGQTRDSGQRGDDRVLVIVGDTFLDRDHRGSPGRLLLPTAVPSIVGVTTTRRPGGAGLAAVWAARMSGWRVCLITALGMDENGCEVRGHLDEADVELVDLGQGGMTMSKSRVIAHGQTVIRYDEAGRGGVPDLDDEAADTAAAALQTAAAIIACDYGQGLLASPQLRAMLTAAAQKAPMVWDPHPRGTQPVVGVTVVVPNSADAAELCERDPLPDAPERLADDVLHGARLLERWKAPAVAVTRGPFGAVLLMGPGSTPLVVPATDIADGDACGAGDVFAVRLVTGLAGGTLLPEAVELAVREASAYVRDGGPAILKQTTDAESGESLTRTARIKQRGGLVVATAGCFDVLHTGHISLLSQAKALGDHLIVCLNSDESVRELKGEGRPVVPAHDRVAMLTALECVNEVLVFSETTPHRILEMIRPNIYVKGADYALNDIPEREIVEAHGGQVVLLPYLAGRSTTGLLRTAASSFKG